MSMPEFHDVRFPLALAFGATGGPEWRTEIVTLASGAEVRNARWAAPRRSWEVGGAISSIDELNALIEFFDARRGRLAGFRFRDFTDDRSGRPDQEPAPGDQAIATGDGGATRFQLVKRHGDTVRRITRPVAGSVRVAVDGAEITAGWSVDTASGELTFDTPPAAGAAITAGFRFDCPARFDTDRLDASLEGFGAGRLVSVRIVEILE